MGTEYDNLEVMADFFNTHDKRMRFENDPGIEHFNTSKDLYDWLLKHQLIPEKAEVTDQDLELAIRLRTAARKIIVNNVFDEQDHGLSSLNEVINRFSFSICFTEDQESLQPLQTDGMSGLARLAILMFELRKNKLWHRIKVCSAADCQWVFVDHSRPGTGRWCTMKACGNRAKNKTYRQKKA